jgi:hypothetical protein
MKARPLWACSAIALEVSLRKSVPSFVQGASLRFGAASFWAALALEGLAIRAWRDLRSLTTDAEGGQSHASANMMQALKDLLARCDGCCTVASAWSLPNNDRMRSLGLGCVWAVLCPFCEEFHTHSPGEELRMPHCGNEQDDTRYLPEFRGTLPQQYQERFCRSVKGGLPRLLQTWPEAGALDDTAEELLAA